MIVYLVQAGFEDSGVSIGDPGFGAASHSDASVANTSLTDDVSSDSPGMSNVMSTIGIMTGFSTTTSNLGVPAGWAFAFSFLFFYVPFFMLLWSVYMALPFLH